MACMEGRLPNPARVACALVALFVWPSAAQQQGATEDALPLNPRASAADYQGHVQAGSVSIGAEFAAHYLPTPAGALKSETFVVVEVGVFGAAGAHAILSADDFSLKINGKKGVPSSPAPLVVTSLRDPDWRRAHAAEGNQ